MKIEQVTHWKLRPCSLNAKMNALEAWNSVSFPWPLKRTHQSIVCWTVIFHEEGSALLPFFAPPLLWKIATVQSTFCFGNSGLIPEHTLSTHQATGYLSGTQFLFFCSAETRCGALGGSSRLPPDVATPVIAHPSIWTAQFAADTPSKACAVATTSPPLCCLITINICCHRGRGESHGRG